MGPKEQAESLFSRIGDGRQNAVTRPVNRTVDRYLRDLVARANERGEVIINVGNGYYRPRFSDPVERSEFEKYINKDISRARQDESESGDDESRIYEGQSGI